MKKLTIEELAKIVAKDFLQTMKQEGFETFAEMKKTYWWTTADIKEEVDYIITEAARKYHSSGTWLSEDGTFVSCGIDNMDWKDFWKLVLSFIKNPASSRIRNESVQGERRYATDAEVERASKRMFAKYHKAYEILAGLEE